MDNYEILINRIENPSPIFSLTKEMIVKKGNVEDWNLLHDLHYKAENLPMGPKFWKLDLHGETIGVLVTGTPKGLLKERHLVFPNLKPTGEETKLSNTIRYKFINQNFRVISRFVVDTMFRGIGCGYKMMNLVSRMEGPNFMEIQSSMSKFNLFGQKAGFKFVKPLNSNKYEAGVKFFKANFESSFQDFEAIIDELNSYSDVKREIVIQKCREFYLRNSALENTGSNRFSAEERIKNMDIKHLIKSMQQVCLASPMYGIWKNPDVDVEIPQELPLNAFEWQKPNERFNFKCLTNLD